jgi:two-component system invasion response regulator UvrY
MQKSKRKNVDHITVLLADDHPLLRNGFFEAMGEDDDIEVVYDTDSPDDACDAYKQYQPTVVVMDILFKEKMTGLDATKKILSIDPQANVVILSQHDQSRLIKEAYQLGALAFIPKGAEPELLVEAVRYAAVGEKYFLPEVAQKLAFLTAERKTDPKDLLSEREFAIYKLIAQDYTNVEISKELALSQKTVNNALYTLRSKLKLQRNTAIAKHALKHGVIKLDDE